MWIGEDLRNDLSGCGGVDWTGHGQRLADCLEWCNIEENNLINMNTFSLIPTNFVSCWKSWLVRRTGFCSWQRLRHAQSAPVWPALDKATPHLDAPQNYLDAINSSEQSAQASTPPLSSFLPIGNTCHCHLFTRWSASIYKSPPLLSTHSCFFNISAGTERNQVWCCYNTTSQV